MSDEDGDDFTLFSQLPSRITSVSDASSSDEASGDEYDKLVGDGVHWEPEDEVVVPIADAAEDGDMQQPVGRRRKELLDSSDEEDTAAPRTAAHRRRVRRPVGSSSDEEHGNEATSNDVEYAGLLDDGGEGKPVVRGDEVVETDNLAENMQRMLLVSKQHTHDTAASPDTCEQAQGGVHVCEEVYDERGGMVESDGEAIAEGGDEKVMEEETAMARDGKHKTPKKVRLAFNHFVREAQTHEKEGRLGHAVASYREAMTLCDEDGKLAKKVAKLENLRAVRRQSKRQSIVVSKVEDDGGVCEAQQGVCACVRG
jgi:hypothetical protein